MKRVLIKQWSIMALLIVFNILQSQNCDGFLNSNFDDFTTCPDAFSQIGFVENWEQVTQGTVDFFACDHWLPVFGPQPSYVNNTSSYVGMLLAYINGVFGPSAEYIGQPLSTPWTAGTIQQISFKYGQVSQANGDPTADREMLILGYEGLTPPTTPILTPNLLCSEPGWVILDTFIETSNPGDLNWKTVNLCITVPTNISYIAIGSCAGAVYPPDGSFSYMLLDDFCVSNHQTGNLNTPNAGSNGTLDICNTATTVDLFSLLSGTPDTGGNWSPALTSGTGLFDPSIDSAGIYTYTIAGSGPCFNDSAQITVDFNQSILVFQPENLNLCDTNNDTVETFNLELLSPIIANSNPNYTVTYHSNQSDANTGINPLPTLYSNTSNPQTIYTHVIENATGCINSDINFNLIVSETVTVNTDTYEICDDDLDNDGDFTNNSVIFDLNSRNYLILGPLQNPSNYTITYHLTLSDANNGTNALANNYQNITNPQTIFVRIENIFSSCFVTSSMFLIVNPLPLFSLNNTYTICIDSQGQIITSPIIDTGLSPSDYSFRWYLNGTLLPNVNSSFTPTSIGNYTIEVSNNITGCVHRIETIVIERTVPTLVVEQVSVTFIDSNDLLATANNNSNDAISYEFNIDGGPWSLSNTSNTNTYLFENISPGVHTINTRDVNGCGIASVQIIVLDYRPYFTPNGDGYNDTWNIIGLENQPNAKIYIFDRYGKLLKQLNPSDQGWDGTFNNYLLPTSDYWFTLDYRDPNTNESKQFKAHFTLKH